MDLLDALCNSTHIKYNSNRCLIIDYNRPDNAIQNMWHLHPKFE